jgi:flap endonuclease-1
VGLPFREIVVAEEIPWSQLAGRTLAVDGYNALYQFLATIRQAGGQPFTDPEGHVTSHLVGLLYRTCSLLSNGVRPVWVFDGKPSELKAGTLRARFVAKERAQEEWAEALAAGDMERARRKAAQTSRLTGPMVEDAKALLDALGVPSVQAPSEGEAQAAHMAARGLVWACASEDYDSLLFGAPRLVRGLAARSVRGDAPAARVVDREKWLGSLGISGEELILLGLLVGTDFNEGAKGYGPKKALKLVQKHLGFESTLREAGIDPEGIAPVAELFHHPSVVDSDPPRFRPPDERRVLQVLVDGHGFAPERVLQAVRKAARPAPVSVAEAAVRGRQPALETFEGAPP